MRLLAFLRKALLAFGLLLVAACALLSLIVLLGGATRPGGVSAREAVGWAAAVAPPVAVGACCVFVSDNPARWGVGVAVAAAAFAMLWAPAVAGALASLAGSGTVDVGWLGGLVAVGGYAASSWLYAAPLALPCAVLLAGSLVCRSITADDGADLGPCGRLGKTDR